MFGLPVAGAFKVSCARIEIIYRRFRGAVIAVRSSVRRTRNSKGV